MCTRYIPPEMAEIERWWHIGRDDGNPWRGGSQLFPRAPGPFIRGSRNNATPTRELVIGVWSLIPWFAKTPKLAYSTNNARFEQITTTSSFKQPWLKGQRCIIPAQSFDEPCWETGKNAWWRFHRADGSPWGLAGLWNAWLDKATGEIIESYTMLTINADGHSLMGRMHKPDPRLPADQQDKRSVIAIDLTNVDQWLLGSNEDAAQLIQVPAAETIDGGPLR